MTLKIITINNLLNILLIVLTNTLAFVAIKAKLRSNSRSIASSCNSERRKCTGWLFFNLNFRPGPSSVCLIKDYKKNIIFILLLAVSPLSQADFMEGVSAYKNSQYEKAIIIFEKLANNGDARAQFALGLMYDNGNGVVEDKEMALKWYLAGAKSGNVKAQFNLAVLYKNGEGTSDGIKLSSAAHWYKKAAENGSKDAVIQLHGLAEEDVIEAQFHLSNLYRTGKAVTKNLGHAFSWCKKAAEADYVPAQYNLGLFYATGVGTNTDPDLALEWYEKAANEGNPKAQYNLALMLLAKDLDTFETALGWLKKSANQDNLNAQIYLAQLFEEGQVTTQNLSEATQWYLRAAKTGDAEAQNYVGYLYLKGIGVEKSEEQALAWFTKAAQQGLTEAEKNKNKILKES